MPNEFRGLGGKYYDTTNPDDVTALQQELNNRGYHVTVDGQYGPETDAAYQAANNNEPVTVGRASVDNPNIAPGLPGSAFGEVNPYGDPNFDISTRPDLQEWQQENLGNPETPDEEAAAVEQMVAERELAERRSELIQQAQDVSHQTSIDAEALLQQRKAARKTGILGRIKDVGTKFLDPVIKVASAAGEAANRAYYAGQYNAEQDPKNPFAFNQGLAAGLPGLGFLAGKNTKLRKSVEATNSAADREELRKQGKLPSFGEGLVGDTKFPKAIPLVGGKRVSGLVDAAFQTAIDPTTYLFPGAESVAKKAGAEGLKAAGVKAAVNLGESGVQAGLKRAVEHATGVQLNKLVRGAPELRQAAMRAGRTEFIDGKLGKTIVTNVEDAIRKGARDSVELTKKVPGLSNVGAREILSAARSGTAEEVRDAIRRAFIEQAYDPKMGNIRRLVGSTTGLGVKGAIVKDDFIRAGLRSLARGTGEGFATGVSRAPNQVLERTLQSAAERSHGFVGDILGAARNPDAAFLDVGTRTKQISEFVARSDNAAFKDAARTELARAAKSEDPAEVERILSRLEGVEHILSGKAGGAARAQAEAELNLGYAQVIENSTDLAKTATQNVGLKMPSKRGVAATAEKAAKVGEGQLSLFGDVKDVAAARGALGKNTLRKEAKDLPDVLRQQIEADIKAADKKGLGKIRQAIDALHNPTVQEEAVRLAENMPERAAAAVAPEVKVGLGRRVLGTAAKLPLSMAESLAPATTSFERGATTSQQIIRRVEAVDRWAAATGLDDFTRSALRRASEGAKTEAELFTAVNEGVRRFAERNGVDPDEFESVYKSQFKKWKADHPTKATHIGADGKIETDIFTKAQLVEEVPLPDPADMRRSVDAIKKGDVDPVTGKLTSFARGKDDGKIKQILKAGHGTWKFSIVTNAYLPVVGAVAGFIGMPGDNNSWNERIKRAGIGFGIGMLGPARYVIRVPLMEERLRFYMDRGLHPTEWVPGLAKWAATRGLDRPFVSESVVHASNVLDRLVGGRLLSTATDDFVSLGKGDSRFVDGWWRIVNHQVHPESDELARILLNEKTGMLTAEEATQQAKDFLKTDEGKVMAQRLAGGAGGSSSPKVIIDKYRQFFDTYINNADLAAARLQVAEKRLAGEVDAEVGRDVLKKAVKDGISPDYIHAQQSWIVPKTVQQAKASLNKSLATLVFEGPTSQINRLPIARSIYRDEYLNLVRGGMEHGRAAEIADEIATKRTNRIMFQVDDESRFAKKIDYVFPFQQPREEFFRVWAPLVKANPGRALKTTRLAALAFNNGEDMGIFRKDPTSHQWVMSVPQSAWLGEHLFGGLVGFDANLKDLLLPAQGAFTAGMGVIPNPGGPWFTTAAKVWATTHPDAYTNMPAGLKAILFPYGLKGNLMRPEAARLWMGMTMSVPPWEFASKGDQQNELDKWTKEVYKSLRYKHWQETGDSTWEPTDQEVKESTRSLFNMWAVVGNTFPASPHPVTPGNGAVNAIIAAHTDSSGKTDWETLNRDYPIVGIFRTATSKYTGPDDFKHWSESEDPKKRNDQFQTGTRRQLTLDEFKGEISDNQRRTQAYREYGDILNAPVSTWEREGNLEDWRQKYPDLASENRQNYFRDVELNRIMTVVPSQDRPAAIDAWRKEYNVSQKEFQSLQKSSAAQNVTQSAWRAARYPEDVQTDVTKKVRQGFGEEAYVATLNPAEQVGYWKTKQSQLNYYSGKADPQGVLDDYARYGQYISAVYDAHPELSVKSPGARFDPSAFNQRILQPYNNAISQAYDEAARLKDAMDTAAQAKQWTAVYAMKDKRDALFDQIKDLKNQMTGRYPQLDENTDIQALMLFADDKDAVRKFNASPEAGTLPWIHSNEEAHYLNMPDGVRKAFVADLVNQVNLPGGTTGKLYWEWLTDFQRSLLEKNLPADKIRNLQSQSPSSSSGSGGYSGGDAKGFTWVNVNGKWVLYYKGTPYRGGSSGSGFGGKFYQGTTIGTGAGELAYALEMFAQYDQRPAGSSPPPAYDAYLNLPANPGVRAQYLKEHPEVGDWIKSGPLANMPDLERYIVTNIMVKYGKWEGDVKTDAEITDLAFAREQLKRWTQRPEGASAPDNYDIWLNMPPGADKQAYLKAHPEVQDWIKLGPMANMPEEYQTVVRDIMLRYGEWTQQQDPMGDVIKQYYATPSYARKKFLEQHPELSDYWASLRTPEENAKYQLSDQYFSMQSTAARKAFLTAHPELQDFFVEARTKRYEKFINQVAQFMGSNPDMFKGYLDRQNDILAELLRRYAEPTLLREAPSVVRSQSTHGVKSRAA